jgi:ADP-ribose pyrophosphatase YjhB (NUDIX family)
MSLPVFSSSSVSNTLAPIELYEQSRKFFPMLCVDCVALTVDSSTGEPLIVLLHRNSLGVAPNTWWIVGGRVGVTETMSQACVRKLHDELGVSVAEQSVHMIGFGTQRFVSSDSQSYNLSNKPYPITTTTFVFCTVLPSGVSVSAGDGNDAVRLVNWKTLLEIDLHPYIYRCVKDSLAVCAPKVDTSQISFDNSDIYRSLR